MAPDSGRHGAEKVRQDEHERADGKLRPMPDDEFERTRESVGRPRPRRGGQSVRDDGGVRRRAGREPRCTLRELIGVREVRTLGDHARRDELEHPGSRRSLVEPRQPTAEHRHRRPTVADDDDAGRLVGEELARDELVRAACGGETGGRGPVDPGDPVAAPVGARAGDLVAFAAARAAVRAEASPGEPPLRGEGNRADARARHASAVAASASHVGSGRGACARHACQTRSASSSPDNPSMITSAVATIRCMTTSGKRRSMSSATT